MNRVGEGVGEGGGGGEGGGRTSAFKQIGSLLAGSTIDGDRMMCLTKYVTVRAYQRENRTFMMVSRWFASRVCCSPLCGQCARACACTRIIHVLYAHVGVLARTGAPMLPRRCINCKIEISASTIITIVNAPTLLLVRPGFRSGSHRSASNAGCWLRLSTTPRRLGG